MGKLVAPPEPKTRGVGAAMAVRLATQAIGLLSRIAELQGREVALLDAHPLMFRAQAASHSATTPGIINGAPNATNEAIKVCEANPARKGILIQNIGTNGAIIALGARPVIDTTDPNVPRQNGILLAGQAGLGPSSWDGLVSGVLWTGEVWSIGSDPTRNFSSLAVTEVL